MEVPLVIELSLARRRLNALTETMNFNRFRLSLTVLAILPLGCVLSKASGYYADWTNSHFADIPSQAGPSSDPDGDGEANLVEFAFGTDPRVVGGISGL